MKNNVLAGLLFSLLCSFGLAAETSSWPIWHGVNHDNISLEKGLLKEWPKDGPALVWKYEGLGNGYASVSIAGGMIFTAGDIDSKNTVIALDMNGKLLWQTATGDSWDKDYPGSRGTPQYNEEMVYHLSGSGMLAALDAKTGKIVWSIDLADKYGSKAGGWGLSESPLIDGNNLICMPGGKKTVVVALNKKTGEQVWATSGLSDNASYCSNIVVEIAGTRQLLAESANYVLGINAKNGDIIWKFPYKTGCDCHATTPVYKDGSIFLTSGYGKGSSLLKLSKDGTSVNEEWKTKDMDNHHGGVVLLDGYIYGSGSQKAGWFCINFEDGKTAWNKKPGKGSLIYADKMLYLLDEQGKLTMIEASPKEFKEVSSFKLPKVSKDTFWAHPVILDGKIYIRHAGMLYVYDLKK